MKAVTAARATRGPGNGRPTTAIDGEFVDAGDRVGPGEDAADGHEDDSEHGMLAGAIDTGFLEILEVLVEGGRSDVGHGAPSLAKMIESWEDHFASLYKESLPSLLRISILMRQAWCSPEYRPPTPYEKLPR